MSGSWQAVTRSGMSVTVMSRSATVPSSSGGSGGERGGSFTVRSIGGLPIRSSRLRRSLGVNTLEFAPPRSLTGPLLAAAATVSVASGLIHIAAVPEHWATYRIAAVFFVGLGIFQVVWAALLVGRPSRLLYAVGAAASLLTIGIWIASRTSGLPFGPFAGVAE